CSPPVTGQTKATLTCNRFEKGGSGALSARWFNNKSRCLNSINIYGNGKSVRAMVVGEYDSIMWCDYDHDYQPPCPNNIVDASKVVWKALRVPEDNWDDLDIYWYDA
ncbi:Putative ripening-related protein 2, partial [Linum perenne]